MKRSNNCHCFMLLVLLFLYIDSRAAANSYLVDTTSVVTYGEECFIYNGPVNCKTGVLSVGTHPNYMSTDFIDVSDYQFVEYTLPVSIIAGVTFYDKEKGVIDGICSTKRWGIFTEIPKDAHYARFSLRTDINRDYTIKLHKEDTRAKYRQLSVDYSTVFSHEEFGKNSKARIPVHIITNRGTILVACQAMIQDGEKTENYVYLARSTDGGKGWAKQMLYKGIKPNMAYDKRHGRIFVFYGQKYMTSVDDGQTWSTPRQLNIAVPEGWDYYSQSPTTGIQLKNGIIATVYQVFCGRDKDITANANFVIYSRDFGRTWEATATTPKEIIANESTIAEYETNQIMINARGGTEQFWDSLNPGRRVFVASTKSRNSRNTWKIVSWTPHASDRELIEPLCSASFISINKKGKRVGLFANPYTTKNPRENIILQISKDFITWKPLGLLTQQYNEVYGYCSLYYNANHLSFIYEDIDKGVMFTDLTNYIKELY